ncbi:MAG: nitronate monooxygenase [Erysipelotrichaceae bacterium]|nr:nitronate monooxygenase [Erysipelotrichaceae bacterium]
MLAIGSKVLDIPIIQGGMGVGISLGNLAGAVMKAGGMGTVSAAHPGYRAKDFWENSQKANCEALFEEARKARRISEGKGILAVNIMVASKDYDLYVKTAVKAGYDAIISGAGLPLNLPEAAGDSGILLAPVISSQKALELVLRVWKRRYERVPDFVVIEGPLAGGHLGFHQEDLQHNACQSLDDIAKDVIEYLKTENLNIPVFCAGGVYTREDIQRLQSLGAAGVQMGTRFIATEECDAHEAFKNMIIASDENTIELVHSPTGYPARGLASPFIQKARRSEMKVHRCVQCLKKCSHNYCITEALIKAAGGDCEEGLFFTGATGCRVDRLMSVKELIAQLI